MCCAYKGFPTIPPSQRRDMHMLIADMHGQLSLFFTFLWKFPCVVDYSQPGSWFPPCLKHLRFRVLRAFSWKVKWDTLRKRHNIGGEVGEWWVRKYKVEVKYASSFLVRRNTLQFSPELPENSTLFICRFAPFVSRARRPEMQLAVWIIHRHFCHLIDTSSGAWIVIRSAHHFRFS